MNITLHLAPEAEQRLREKATRQGQTLEAYLEQLAEADSGVSNSMSLPSPSPLDPAEFDRLLDEFSQGLPHLPSLPADFSRADLSTDHD